MVYKNLDKYNRLFLFSGFPKLCLTMKAKIIAWPDMVLDNIEEITKTLIFLKWGGREGLCLRVSIAVVKHHDLKHRKEERDISSDNS